MKIDAKKILVFSGVFIVTLFTVHFILSKALKPHKIEMSEATESIRAMMFVVAVKTSENNTQTNDDFMIVNIDDLENFEAKDKGYSFYIPASKKNKAMEKVKSITLGPGWPGKFHIVSDDGSEQIAQFRCAFARGFIFFVYSAKNNSITPLYFKIAPHGALFARAGLAVFLSVFIVFMLWISTDRINFLRTLE